MDVQEHLPPVLWLGHSGLLGLTLPQKRAWLWSTEGQWGAMECGPDEQEVVQEEVTNTAQSENLHNSGWIYVN